MHLPLAFAALAILMPGLAAQDRLLALGAAPVPGKNLVLQASAPPTSAGRPFLIYWSGHTDFILDLPIAFLRGSLRIDLAGFANPALLVGIVPPSGRALTGLPIPNDPNFLGQTIDLQSLEVDFVNFLLYLGDNDAVVTFVSGVGSTALVEGYLPSTIRGDLQAQLVVDATLGRPSVQTLPAGAFQPLRHAGELGFVEGYPHDFVETPGASAIDLHRGERVARHLRNGIQQSVALPNGFELAVLRLALDCRDFALVAIEANTGLARELTGSRRRDTVVTCPPTTRFSIYRPDFAFSKDGEVALAVARDTSPLVADRLLLVHTDPTKTWVNNRNVVDITPPGAARFVDGGLLLTMGRVVAIAEQAGNIVVFEGPADGATLPQQVTLPRSGTNQTPTTSDGAWRLSSDGATACFALANGQDGDVWSLRGLGGTLSAHQVSGFTAATRLAPFRRDTAGADGSRAALSPIGTRVAFVSGGGDRGSVGAHELFLARSDGSDAGAPLALLAPNFAIEVDWVGGLHFATEDRLFFFAGEDGGACDLYAYDVTAARLTNVTKTSTGSTTAPPFTQGGSTGNVASRGTFTSGNGRYLYFVRGFGGRVPSPSPETNNLVAVDTASLALRDITGNDFATGGTSFQLRSAPLTTYEGFTRAPRPALELGLRRAPGSSPLAFFVAEAALSFAANEVQDCNVFAFDIENAGVARALTTYSGKGAVSDVRFISQLTVSPDAAHVAYALRLGDPRASEDVFVVKTDGSAAPRQLSKSRTAQTIGDGSITFTGPPTNGIVWSRGSGSQSLPFVSTVAEWSLVAGQPEPFVLSAPSTQQRIVLVLSSSPRNP